MIVVRVDRMLPYESTDPDRLGPVHAVMIEGVLVVSREAFHQLKKLSDAGGDAFDELAPTLLSQWGVKWP